MADIFVSYSKKDLARSALVKSLLEREGYSVAIDREFLRPGDEYRTSILQEIDQAKVVIVLWSVNAVESAFVRDEASRATRRTVLLQLIIDEMSDDDVPLGFGELQWLRCQWTPEGELAKPSRDELFAQLRRQLPAVAPLSAAVVQLQKEVDTKLGSEYEVEAPIGTGRMSVVFKARHRVQGTLALKVTPLAGILLLPGFYAEFRDILEAARELSHANILTIRDVRLLDTIACTVTDFVDGASLSNCIARAGSKMPLGRIKDIASDIADALSHAHQNGVFHGSLSPCNILIERAQDRVLVSDFGMPKMGSGPDATAARALFLDVRYMSPEQCLGGTSSPQSDQYSLGAILYEMLTGKPPFVGKSAYQIMKGHCEDQPRPIAELRPECPQAVADSVMRLLSKSARDRYLTTGMLASEVAAWPLAESVRDGNPGVRRGRTGSAKAALESYNRCLAEPNFLATFYERVREEPSLARHLETMNFDRQVEALRRAIRHLLEFALGLEDARLEIERVAAMHQHFKLEEKQLRSFVDTFIEVTLECDPKAIDPAQRELLRAEWQVATEPGLQRFAELAQIAMAKVSSIVPRGGGEPAPVAVQRVG